MEIKSFFTLLTTLSLMLFFFLLGLAVIYGGLKHWFKLVILSVFFALPTAAFVIGVAEIEERFSKEIALIVGLPLTLLLIRFLLMAFAEILGGD